MPDHVVHVVGARPNFIKAAPVIARARPPCDPAAARPHRPALRRTDVGRVLPGPRPAGARREPRRRLRHPRRADGGARWSRLEGAFARRPAEPGGRLRRRELARSPAASSAAKLQVPSAHVEAGLRSFDLTMPEEINRLVTDLLADLLFVTSPEAVDHLAARAWTGDAHPLRGQPDDRHAAREPATLRRPASSASASASTATYAVATLHRPANVDAPTPAPGPSSRRSTASPRWSRSSSRCTRAAGRTSRRPG